MSSTLLGFFYHEGHTAEQDEKFNTSCSNCTRVCELQIKPVFSQQNSLV